MLFRSALRTFGAPVPLTLGVSSHKVFAMAQPKSNRAKKAPAPAVAQKRTYLKQTDVPAASLDEALRIPQAIFDHYAGKPTAPLYVAKALNVDPRGSQLKVLSGAAIAFGLIEGGAQASTISVTDLAKRILRPKEEGADVVARREEIGRAHV